MTGCFDLCGLLFKSGNGKVDKEADAILSTYTSKLSELQTYIEENPQPDLVATTYLKLIQLGEGEPKLLISKNNSSNREKKESSRAISEFCELLNNMNYSVGQFKSLFGLIMQSATGNNAGNIFHLKGKQNLLSFYPISGSHVVVLLIAKYTKPVNLALVDTCTLDKAVQKLLPAIKDKI